MGLGPGKTRSLLQLAIIALASTQAGTWALAATGWLGAPFSLSIPTHISHLGQVSDGSTILPLEHDTPITVSVSAPAPGTEVLSSGAGTLTTSYKITGIAAGDADWVNSSDFLTHSYFLPGSNITDQLTLWVRAQAPSDRAPDPGSYSATITLTATW
jgi:hypothetical protein